MLEPREVPLGGPRALMVRRTLPAARALAHRRLVLRRLVRPHAGAASAHDGHAAASAHRAADRELALPGRDRAPRLGRSPCHGRTGAGQSHDGRRRHPALGGLDRRRPHTARRAALDRAARRVPRRSPRSSRRSRPSRSRTATRRCECSSASCSVTARRSPGSRSWSAPSSTCPRAVRSASRPTRRSSTASWWMRGPRPCRASRSRRRTSASSRQARRARHRGRRRTAARAAHRRRAARRADRDVVELRRAQPRRGGRVPRAVAGGGDRRRRHRRTQRDGRFGAIDGYDGSALPAPELPNVRLRPRE